MRAVVSAVLAALLLGACSGDPEPSTEITVTGEAGELPDLHYEAPLEVTEPRTEVLWEGTGPPVVEGEPVLLHYLAENTRDRSVASETYSTKPSARRLTPEDLGLGLYEALRGVTVGSRVLHVAPPEDGVPLAVVIDVLPTRASGEPVEPREGLPTVTLGPHGAPKIELPDGDPPAELVVQPLILGSGPQVQPGQVITVQYTAVSWDDGELYASTWGAETPMVQTEIGVGQQLTGWDDGLIEQRVGSQVMLIVPPAQAFGEDTLVFVVDILAADGQPTTEPEDES